MIITLLHFHAPYIQSSICRPEISTAPKNDHEAAVNRKKACDLLQDADYQAALKYFNKSIMLANPDSETLTLAYLDRSAVFHRAGKLKKANQDIQRAMQLSKSPEVTQLLQSLQARFQFQQDSPGQGRKCVSLVVNTAHPDRCVVEPKPDYWESLGQGQRHLQYGRESGVQAALPDPSTPANAGGMEAKLQLTTSQGRNSWEGDGPATTPVLETIFDHGCNPNPKPESLGEPAEAVSFPLRVDGPENPLLPGCSTAVEPCFDPAHGWGLVAARDITPGEVLMTETPAVKILLRDFWDSHCTWCLQAADACVPCYTCTKVTYCSESCRDSSWNTFHRYECPMIANLSEKSLEDGCLLCVRLLTNTGPEALRTLRNTLEQVNMPTWRSAAFTHTRGSSADWHPHPLVSVFCLPSKAECRGPAVLYKAAINAVYIVKCLRANADFWAALSSRRRSCSRSRDNDDDDDVDDNANNNPPSDDEEFLARLAFSLVLISACNSFPVHEVRFGDDSKPPRITRVRLGTIGVGIAPVCSVLAHSCDPNAVRLFVDDSLVVRALRRVAAGEPVQLAYGMHYYQRDKAARVQSLSSTRHEDCACRACVEEWPTLEEMAGKQLPPPRAGCPACADGGAAGSGPCSATAEDMKCERCGQDVSEALTSLKELQDAAAYLSQTLEPASVSCAIDVYHKIGLCSEALFRSPNKHTAFALQQLNKLYLIQAALHGQQACRDAGTKSFHGRECGLLDALEVDVLDHRVLLALRWFLSLADKSCPGLGQRKRDFASGDDHDTKGDPSRCPVYHQKDLHELLPIMLDTKVSLAKCDKKDEFWFQAMSVLFTAKLLTRGDSPSSENDQVAKAASTLWHILLASQQATHPLVSYGAEPGAGDRLGVKLVRVGECISWVLGAAFQSCAPNAVQAFVAGKILVRAVDVISAGTLIKVSFGVLSHNHNLEDRSRFLLEKFNYVCRCLACVENWPRLTDWNRPRIVACPGCQSQFELLTEPVCGTCGRTLLPEIEAIVALKNLAEDQIAGMSRKPRTRPETTRSLLRTFQELQLRMKPLFVKPCKDLLMAQSHVMRVVMMDTIARRL
ncbi:unnamed protein product [Notodromas monacha]|uniref:SET and MYND domain-containing protein 4 n=1 Tax=Notodromas monacha TaxID=399045 RepID=A0A7R9BQC0_9CRUS|nr:unnamed protein product [Notodromas monacha]CAG0918856.1 unnamed protein product [Notodromas monacha]